VASSDARRIAARVGALGAVDPYAHVTAVSSLYGGAMCSVQFLEHSLAFLSIVVTHDPSAQAQGTLRDQFSITFERWWRAYQKDTAGRALRKIQGKIPDDLYDDLQACITRRNWLAHRFFVECIETGDDGRPRFAIGAAADLINLTAESAELTKRVTHHQDSVRASWARPTDEPPPEFTQWAEDFAQLVTRRRVRPEVLADLQNRSSTRSGS